MDQQINYRVNIDDANFQAKLTQMRASMDQTMMGGGGYGGGGGGGSMGYFQRMGATMGMTGGNGMGMDFSGMSPISYTAPAIAMTPHFGMLQVKQTFGQQLANSMGMGSLNPFSFKGMPNGISPNELGAISSKGMADRVSDMASTGIMTGLNLAVGTVGSIVGAGIGTALGGPAGTLIGGIVGGMGASKLIGGIEEGVVQNRAIQADLEKSSFRFITGGKDVDKDLGYGFSRDARFQAAKDLQRVADTDPRYGIKEMREIQNMGIDKGLFTGKVTDTESLNNETLKLKESIKKITDTLHGSIKEAGETLQSLKAMGVTDDKTISRITTEAQTLGRMTGRTGQEMMAAGQAGASIFQGTGVRMGLGAEANMQNLMHVRKMLDQGTLTQESVAQAGGEEAMAQTMTANQLSSTQTQFGRTALLANFDAKTGGLRKDYMQRMMKGDAMSMLQEAASKSPLDIIQADAHQEDIISKMSPAELAMIPIAERRAKAKTLIEATRQGRRHLSEEEAYRFVSKREGLSKSQIDADIATMHTDNKKISDEVESETNISKRNQDSAMAKDARSIKNITNKVDQFAHAQSEAIMDVSHSVGNKAKGLMDKVRAKLDEKTLEMSGQEPSDVTKAAAASGTAPGNFRSEQQKAAIESAAVVTDASKSGNRAAVQGATSGMMAPSTAAPAANTQPQVGGGDTTGPVLETQKHLKTMSDQLVSQYTMLINMQKELNALMMQGRK